MVRQRKRLFLPHGDALWTTASFAFVGLSGLLLILGVARFYSPATLGAFNLVFSFYMLGSQLVGAGIHFSVLHHVPSGEAHRESDPAVVPSALVCSAANSVVWIVVLLLAAPLALRLYHSAILEDSIWFIFPALFFCGQNKVLLSYLNAMQEMRRFAVFTSLRAFAILGLLVTAVAMKLPDHRLPLILTGAEMVLYLALFANLQRKILATSWSALKPWFRRHFSFGYRSVIGSVFIDLNTRVDVIVLGLFSSDRVVGIYSLAAMLYDGFAQLPMVIRTLINPQITSRHIQGGAEAVERFSRSIRNRSYLALGALGLLILALYLPMVGLLSLRDDFRLGFAPLAILMTGAMVTVGYSPLLMIFNQLGFPFRQSILYLICFGSNLILTFLLVPWGGMRGAALGTAASFIAFVIALKIMARRVAGIRI